MEPSGKGSKGETEKSHLTREVPVLCRAKQAGRALPLLLHLCGLGLEIPLHHHHPLTACSTYGWCTSLCTSVYMWVQLS